MTAYATALPLYQFFDANGDPLVGGKLYSYEAGTTTPLATYTDSTGTIPNTNPIILDSNGQCQMWLGTNAYKLNLVDANDVQQDGWPLDEVTSGAAQLTNNLANTSNVSLGDALVGVKQPFQNSVSRTAHDKFQEFVSVKDFGAIGDGLNDDTNAIQSGINYIKQCGGGTLYIPFGNYKITSTLQISGNFGLNGIEIKSDNAKITCSGDYASILIDAYSSGGASSADEYRINAYVHGLTFYGPGISSMNSVGIKIQYSANVLIKDCYIRNFRTGISGLGVLISRFENINISYNYIGISFNYCTTPVSFACNDNHFVGCRIWSNTKAIFYSMGSGGNTTFDHCEIEGNNLSSSSITDGIKVVELYLCGKIVFYGCHIENNKGQYNIVYSGKDATGSINFVSTQFLLSGDTGYGIYLDSTVGTPNSLLMYASSLGMCTTNDIYIGSGFSASLIETPIAGSIGGDLTKLNVMNNGSYCHGVYSQNHSPFFVKSNASNVSIDADGLIRQTDTSGATRYSYIYGNSSSSGMLSDSSPYIQIGFNSGAPRIVLGRLGTATVEPYTDNTHSLGTSGLRWSVVYAATGTINTSDRNEKQQIRSIQESERIVALKCKSLIRAFKFNDAVGQKGDLARTHIGVIAQDVIEAFRSEGLDANKYAIICFDEWDDHYEEILDEDGKPTGEKKRVIKAGSRYGVRYEELLCFIMSAL